MPDTRYVKSDDINIAYQVTGDGPVDLIYAAGWVTNIEVMWDDPGYARFLRRLASFSRLITYDKRGVGLSDRVADDELANIDGRMKDMTAVLDAAESERTVLFGHSEGGSTAIQFAHAYPERTESLILACAYARRLRSDDYPWAPSLEERRVESKEMEADWANPQSIVDYYAPSHSDDPAFVSWLTRYLRLAASPHAAAALNMASTYIDVTHLLPELTVPTLCLYRRDDTDVALEEGRYIASKVPDARFVEVPGVDHFIWAGDWEPILQEIEEFVTGSRGAAASERVVATVLFTDIVGSTELASSMGDTAWRDLLEHHDRLSRAEAARWGGRVIKTTGDGVLAVFDGPRPAIRFAQGLFTALEPLGITIRCGIHTGEVEMVADDVAGLGVHIASRLSALAEASEIVVSRTVRDLVAGSEISFESRGVHELKGVPEPWEALVVT